MLNKPYTNDYPITSGYKTPQRPNHRGIDIGMPQGTPLIARDNGVVTYSGFDQWGGYYIDIAYSDNKTKDRLVHLSKWLVAKNDKVRKGQTIGNSGGQPGTVGAGNSTGSHLHWEVFEYNKNIDPTPLVNNSNNNNNNNTMSDYNKALPDTSKNKFNSRVNALRQEDRYNAVHWDSVVGYIYSTNSDYEYMIDTIARNAMDYRNQVEILKAEVEKQKGIVEIHKLRIDELTSELNTKNSSNKPFWESKKAIALATGVITVMINSIIPLINREWQMPITELLTLIGAYIGIQGVGDAINIHNKK